jgi:hypothetical protein
LGVSGRGREGEERDFREGRREKNKMVRVDV